MGGIIGVTIRFSDRTEWRGSCWTNVLPDGLFAADFYINKEESEKHVREWLRKLLENRKQNDGIEDLWGKHDALAPVEYGIVVIDFTGPWVLAHNHYTSVGYSYYVHKDDAKKFDRLFAARVAGPSVMKHRLHYYKINSFWIVDEADRVDGRTLIEIEKRFELNIRERTLWRKYFQFHDIPFVM